MYWCAFIKRDLIAQMVSLFPSYLSVAFSLVSIMFTVAVRHTATTQHILYLHRDVQVHKNAMHCMWGECE